MTATSTSVSSTDSLYRVLCLIVSRWILVQNESEQIWTNKQYMENNDLMSIQVLRIHVNTIYKHLNKSWINSSLMECSWIAACLTFHARLASKRSFACHRVKLTSLGGGFASWYVHLHKLSSHIMFLHVFLGFASATSAPTPIMKGCHALMYLVARPRSQSGVPF